ncbi:MAG: (Fe-S)-binding protein [Phycisphaerae bacterium]
MGDAITGQDVAPIVGDARTISLFVPCLTDTFFPRVGEAAVRVLRWLGCRIRFAADQTCCGQPAFNSGFRAEAITLARRMIDVFDGEEPIVTPSASCATMVKHRFPELLCDSPGERAAAERLAARVHEFTSFITDVLGVEIGELLASRASADSVPLTTFHFPCHARELHAADAMAEMLARGLGERFRASRRATLCCGFGGLFGVEFADVSNAMMGDKLQDLLDSGAETVISNEAGCTLHLAGGARRRNLPLRFKHVAECLAEALGLMEPM